MLVVQITNYIAPVAVDVSALYLMRAYIPVAPEPARIISACASLRAKS
jgi:hypothetical protein